MPITDWSEWKARRAETPAIVQVPLCADGSALSALEGARADVAAAEAKVIFAETQHAVSPGQKPKQAVVAAKKARVAAKRRVKTAEKAVAEATMLVSVQQMAPNSYRALKDAHKPTDPEKLARGDEWEEATFAPALIAESLVDEQTVTPADVPDMWNTLSLPERAILFLTCHSLNETVPDLGFIEPDTDVIAGIGRP